MEKGVKSWERKPHDEVIEVSDNIYNIDVVESLVEDDELSYEEAGFMDGYNDF